MKITHRKFEYISALTIGMDPAYRQTTVNAREIGGETSEQKAEREKQQKAEREAQMQRNHAHRSRILAIESSF